MDNLVSGSACIVNRRPGSPVPRGVRVRVRNKNARARAYRDAGRPYSMNISPNRSSVVQWFSTVSLMSMVVLQNNNPFSELAELCSRAHKC